MVENKYIQTFSEKVPINVFFLKHYKQLPKESMDIFDIVSKIYEIKNVDDYKNIYDFLWIDFNYHRVLIKYDELAKMTLPFDDDIIKFIAFLYGTSYFIRIGYPDLDVWLNAKDINHPFEETKDVNEGFTLLEAVNYEYGQNAVRAMLLSTLKWIGPQGG